MDSAHTQQGIHSAKSRDTLWGEGQNPFQAMDFRPDQEVYTVFETLPAIAAIRVLEAERTPIRGKLDFKHLCDIHRYIFNDIFEWAGKLRAVNISRGNPFYNAEVLDVFGAELFGKLKAEPYLLDIPRERIAELLAHFISVK